MPIDPVSAVCFLAGTFGAWFVSQSLTSSLARRQQEIAQRGLTIMGRIVGIWRPPLAGSFTRLYIEFEPPNWHGPVRACHIDRREAGELNASLPSVGTTVNIKYLPERPQDAVIAKLVSRFMR
ncbi:MAG TPA: hypothetical protein VJS42_02525 [Steroidobacteraceae bacterium]|nr:hypothetical protein [Steroidobacteraceae bacterium]